MSSEATIIIIATKYVTFFLNDDKNESEYTYYDKSDYQQDWVQYKIHQIYVLDTTRGEQVWINVN